MLASVMLRLTLITMATTRICKHCGAHNRIPIDKIAARGKCGKCKKPLGPQRSPVTIQNEHEFSKLVHSGAPIVVDFWAEWCGPCRMVAPELEKLSQSKAGQIVVAKVNTEQLGSVAARFGIQSIPTLVLIKDGVEKARLSGAMRAEAIAAQLGL